MSETLSIRLAAEEKAQWERAAAKVQEGVAEFVRNAVRRRVESAGKSPWEKHLGSVATKVAAPTNPNVRRAFTESRKRKA